MKPLSGKGFKGLKKICRFMKSVKNSQWNGNFPTYCETVPGEIEFFLKDNYLYL
jgi:hypothetical protein